MKEIIFELIQQKFGKSVSLDTHIREFCEDSISMVEFLFDVEHKLNKTIYESDIFEIETVRDLITFLSK